MKWIDNGEAECNAFYGRPARKRLFNEQPEISCLGGEEMEKRESGVSMRDYCLKKSCCRGIGVPSFWLLIASLAISFLVGEVTLRIILGNERSDRSLMWSAPIFDVDSRGAVKFVRNSYIRDAVVYDGSIEYDMIYPTNNLGFADDRNYEPTKNRNISERQFAFVGDSFTVGQGGFLWVSSLRDKLISSNINVRIYNLGVPGTGLSHFVRILESAAEDLDFTDIVILGLSDDMRRPYWVPSQEDGHIFFCIPGHSPGSVKSKLGPVATIVDYHATQEEILECARSYEKSNMASKGVLREKGIKAFMKRSRLLRFIKKYYDNSKPIDLEPIHKIIKRFPGSRIYFIQLPQKDEVRRGKYVLDLKQPMESLGIVYVSALANSRWSLDMFHKKDAHPNKAGYENIMNIVEQSVFGL